MRTPSSATTGRPAKSLGSRSEPMTVSHGTPSAAAAAWISADLPMPGSPQRQTATPARPAARSTVTMLVAVPVTGVALRNCKLSQSAFEELLENPGSDSRFHLRVNVELAERKE